MSDNSESTLSYQPKVKGYSFKAAPAPQPAETEPVQKPKGKTNPFVVLILEVAGLITLFVIFLLVLNFFGVISLSNLYPTRLSQLLHQNLAINNPSTSSVNEHLPKVVSGGYDWSNAQKKLESFLRETIKPGSLPSAIEGYQGGVTASNSGVLTEYGTKWTNADGSIAMAAFHYNPDPINKTENYTDVFITIPNASSDVATKALTQELTQKYLQNITANTNFQCGAYSNNLIYICESMQSASDAKKGVGVITVKSLATNTNSGYTQVFSCIIPNTSANYKTWDSCIIR